MIRPIIELSTNICMQVYNRLICMRELNLWSYIPRQCLLCKTRIYSSNICHECDLILPRLVNKCLVCCWPVTGNTVKCNLCLYRRDFFKDVIIALPYFHPIDKLIHHFKYKQDLTKGRLLADIFLRYILSLPDYQLPQVIIPVPLSHEKLRQRGFNQSLEIARYLAYKLNIKLDCHLISKFKTTNSQMGQSKINRINNVTGSFCFNKRPSYQSVAIVDDVITTGSTIFAIHDLLAEAGVKNISIWALARRM